MNDGDQAAYRAEAGKVFRRLALGPPRPK